MQGKGDGQLELALWASRICFIIVYLSAEHRDINNTVIADELNLLKAEGKADLVSGVISKKNIKFVVDRLIGLHICYRDNRKGIQVNKVASLARAGGSPKWAKKILRLK